MWLDRYMDEKKAVATIRGESQPNFVRTGYGLDAALFDFSDAAQRVIPSVVNIDTAYIDERIFGRTQVTGGSGSGVVIADEGYIVTNAHVVRHPRYRTKFVAADIVIVRTSDGREYEAKVIGADTISDIAVLKVDADDLVPCEFGDSSDILVGQWVMAVGNQLGFENSVSVGVVSSKNRWLETQDKSILIDAIQTDASINRGNSGGALCNSEGQVIGINSMIAVVSNSTTGVGFAIPIKHVQRVTADLIERGNVHYAVLGINLPRNTVSMLEQRHRTELAAVTGYSDLPEYGLFVIAALADFPAGLAGMTENSVLMEIDGRRLYRNIDYHRSMMEQRPGDEVEIKFWSKGVVKEVTVTLSDSTGSN